jgi:hypothetical protein
MTLRNKLALLQDLLENAGYSGWYATKTNNSGHPDSDAKYILFNFKDAAKAEIIVPDAWFLDPDRYNVIQELISLSIEDYSVPASA